ncbi:MAG: hypothetical protein AAGE86_08205 [Pseudomonadota bacterium]
MIIGRFVLLAALALAGVTPLSAQEAVSSKDLRALSDKKADRQAREDLDALLEDFSGYKVGNRINFQGDVWFWTAPRASITPGMCERDLLQIFYEPAFRGEGSRRDPKVRARSIATTRYYGFVEAPNDESLERALDEGKSPSEFSDRKCRSRLKDEWVGWFEAASPIIALQGYNAVLAANAAVKSGAMEIENCAVATDEGAAERCLETLGQALDFGRWTKVERSGGSNKPHTFVISGGSFRITIAMKELAYKPVADNVASITVEDVIIVT